MSDSSRTAGTDRDQRRRVGWGGRIRTFEYGIQSPAPYRLATPHHVTACRRVAPVPPGGATLSELLGSRLGSLGLVANR